MEISHTDLTPETLKNLVEEFVSREGADYGHNVYNLNDKVVRVMKQLDSGRAIIVYDAESQSCHIILKQ
jgi:uncharacterized protein